MDDWSDYEGKRVFIKLINGREYSGKVLEINGKWLIILDKFNINVKLQLSEISVIELERRE
jgi:small nuclear ribonucleoprotein (snRNP)-like protein